MAQAPPLDDRDTSTRAAGRTMPPPGRAAAPLLAADPAIGHARTILRHLFGPPQGRGFGVRLWDGSVEGAGADQAPRFTLVVRRPGALRRMLLPPSELALSEAYLRDDFDVEGDMEAAAALAESVAARLGSPGTMARLVRSLWALPTDDLPSPVGGGPAPDRGSFDPAAALRRLGLRHSRPRDLAAVRFHYDVGNDFYALWLDRRMVYSCAYFATGTEDIDTAQTAKLEYLCRKLRLRPGERLLDIGCGWGGLVQYAAERYGVDVTGITLSEAQAALARQRIAAAGLGSRCRAEVRDYRDLPAGTAFDKIVSVGMVEHVGGPNLPAYFASAYRCLKPGGLFLNHGIVAATPVPATDLAQRAKRLLWQQGAFIQRYVFPDSELVPPGDTIRHAERAGFETRDVENLREHYALTVRHWIRRLEARRDEAVSLVGEPTYRVWRLYMSGCARSFAMGGIGVAQALFSKPGPGGAARLPLTRADLYRAIGHTSD